MQVQRQSAQKADVKLIDVNNPPKIVDDPTTKLVRSTDGKTQKANQIKIDAIRTEEKGSKGSGSKTETEKRTK